MSRDGAADVARAAEDLAARLPPPLAPLAELAFNYWWSWTPGGPDVFRSIDPNRWEATGHNPVRLLQETTSAALDRAAKEGDVVARAEALARELRTYLARPPDGPVPPRRPVAFLCAEFGVHRSLPVYAGGLGVLAGDLLKEASDRAAPFVAMGMLYRYGYLHQRVDASGRQLEYWTEVDPSRLPAALVTGRKGRPLVVKVPLRGREVALQVWRVDVGRVPLYLLDARRPENSRIDRWITARLYVGDRSLRLTQYAILGAGAIRALRALGIDPSVVHLNEGHAVLAPLELARTGVEAGLPFSEAMAAARARTVFTTHTPVLAGNEAFSVEEIEDVMGDLPSSLGIDREELLGVGRTHPEDGNEPFGLTVLGIRMARAANGVSRRHGEVARSMWSAIFPGRPVEDVPIGHVTNGVHLPTWMAPGMRGLLDRYLGTGWEDRAADPDTWAGVEAIPDEELWAVRGSLRAELVSYIRDRSVSDLLGRGESSLHAEMPAEGFQPDVLTVGFARRLAGYKRLYLLGHDPARALRLLEGEQHLQLVLAGKAHAQDEEGKQGLQTLFAFKSHPAVARHVAFLEDYDLSVALQLVWGCDLWVNLPRPPLEASGTSGMKSALNGGVNLSVMDGWWEEAFDGTNGWAIEDHGAPDATVQDARHAAALYDLLDQEVIPQFYDRDEAGIPRAWVRRIKASLRSIGPRFNATRMLRDYVQAVYVSDHHSSGTD
jgi:starch phosphorylase